MISLDEWGLAPGPVANPPLSSVELGDIEEYPPEIVSSAVLSFDGMRLLHSEQPTWWDWRARWERDGRWIEIRFTLFDVEPPSWGGSQLQGRCKLVDIMGLWTTVRRVAPGCWMHNDDCEIHTPESFVEWVKSTEGRKSSDDINR